MTSTTGPCEAAAEERDTLFYDGQCPLCNREIAQLRAVRGDALALVDIHSLAAAAPAGDAGPDREALLRTLHLRRGDGRWLNGADANVAAWEGTAQGRFMRILRWPLLRPLVDRVYAYWAGWRYRRLYGDRSA
ncbi:MAG: thiol-disulfide oxidoreductase DCC family protein [Anaerolineae bacterium]